MWGQEGRFSARRRLEKFVRALSSPHVAGRPKKDPPFDVVHIEGNAAGPLARLGALRIPNGLPAQVPDLGQGQRHELVEDLAGGLGRDR
jgi:hypothetical protein